MGQQRVETKSELLTANPSDPCLLHNNRGALSWQHDEQFEPHPTTDRKISINSTPLKGEVPESARTMQVLIGEIDGALHGQPVIRANSKGGGAHGCDCTAKLSREESSIGGANVARRGWLAGRGKELLQLMGLRWLQVLNVNPELPPSCPCDKRLIEAKGLVCSRVDDEEGNRHAGANRHRAFNVEVLRRAPPNGARNVPILLGKADHTRD